MSVIDIEDFRPGIDSVRMRRMDSRDFVYLFPREIMDKLEQIAQRCGFNTREMPDELGRALRTSPGRRLRELGRIVGETLLAQDRLSLKETYDRLAEGRKRYLRHLVRSARIEAEKLDRTQPTMPLALPPDLLGYWSNLLTSGWIDFSEGGKRQIIVRPRES